MATNKSSLQQKEYTKRLWLAYGVMAILAFLLFIVTSMGWFGFMPSFEELENPKSNLASEIYSADQQLLGKYYIENRSNIHYSDLNAMLVAALISTEDSRFYKHSGIDLRGTIAGVLSSLRGDKRGASTITQQLAKNLFPRAKNPSILKVIFIKMKEWITAVKLERNYSKEEIIAMYFNTVPFGSNSFGIKTAAKTFYNTSPDSLKIEEGAMLVGMLKAPTAYNPIRNPERAMKRREVVLHQMLKSSYLTREQYDSLRVIPFNTSLYKIQDHNAGPATYFREFLRGQMMEWCKNNKKSDGTPYDLYKDGLRIYTTIDSRMQKYAEESVKEHLGKELQGLFYKEWASREKIYQDAMKAYYREVAAWLMAPRSLKRPEKPSIVPPPFSHITYEQYNQLMNSAIRRSERYYWLRQDGTSRDSIDIIFNTPVPMSVFAWDGANTKLIDTVMSPIDSIRYYKYFLRAGIMAIEPQTGFIRAYVGGYDYTHFKYDQVSQAKRQVGSTFKPFVYALAVSEGDFSPCTKGPNVPVSIELPNGQRWEPRNAGSHKEYEMIRLKEALANSINWVSAYLMKQMSPQAVVDLVRKMGIKSPIEPVYAIALGACDLSLFEMVGANATFANKGVFTQPMYITRIEDKNGRLIQHFNPVTNEAMSEQTAYLMIEMLKGVVESGTGIRLRYRYGLMNPIAGKTGTTQNQSDGWFMGLTPDLVAGAWVGCEDRSAHFRSITYGQGAAAALPIWAIFMKKVQSDKTINLYIGDFEKPSKPLDVEVDCQEYDKNNRNTEPPIQRNVF